MKPWQLVALSLLPMLWLVSAGGQDYGERDTGVIISITPRTEFPPGYNAELQTSRTYPCTGYNIRSSVSWEEDTLTISIGGFVRPSPCVPLSGRAKGNVYLGDIGKGRYILRIRYRSEEDLHFILRREKENRIDSRLARFTEIYWE